MIHIFYNHCSISFIETDFLDAFDVDLFLSLAEEVSEFDWFHDALMIICLELFYL